MKKIYALIFSVILLTGCSSSNVDLIRYNLLNNVSSFAYEPIYDLRVFLYGSYADDGIVIKTSDTTLYSASNHVWDIPLARQLTIMATEQFREKGVDLGERMFIRVSKFHGDLKGNVEIEATLVVKNENEILFMKTYALNEKQDSDGYDALVVKLSSGWKRLCSQMAKDLKQI